MIDGMTLSLVGLAVMFGMIVLHVPIGISMLLVGFFGVAEFIGIARTVIIGNENGATVFEF